MTHYSVQHRDRIFVNGFDHAKQSATDAYKTASKTVIQKIAESIGDLIDNKITDSIINVSNALRMNN